MRELSPKTVQSAPAPSLAHLSLPNKASGSFSPPRTLPQSPWLTEAAQVQALQRPASQQMSFTGVNVPSEQRFPARKRSSGERSAGSSRGRKKATKSKSSWYPFQRSKVSQWHFQGVLEGQYI